jgi:DNA modification methylase
MQKRLAQDILPGFVWEDPAAGHILACGDSRDSDFVFDVLSRTEGSPSLLLTDPPYAVSSDLVIGNLPGHKDMFLNETWDRLSEGDLDSLLRTLCTLAAEVLPNGNAWVWTSDWWLSLLKRWLREAGFEARASFVWCKPNPPCSIRKRTFVSACEFLAVGQGNGAFFDLSSMPRQRNYFVAHPDGTWVPAVCPNWVERPVVGQAERLLREDKKEYLNRAQKPLDLSEALVRAGCPDGGLVLDPFGGTGTTLLAADRSGRRCVYIDLDPVQVRATGARLIRDRRERGRA